MYLYIGHTESKSLSESPVPVLGTRFAAAPSTSTCGHINAIVEEDPLL